jgi:hypothetical protein
MDCGRNDGASRRCYAFKASGDVDSRPEQVAILVNHVSDMDADADLKRLFSQGFLKCDCAPDGVHSTRELSQDAITCGVGNSAAVSADLVLCRFSDGAQGSKSLRLVSLHALRVTHDIRRHDRGEPMFEFYILAHEKLRTRKKC